jgi:Acetyltransferase (GNAT) domain
VTDIELLELEAATIFVLTESRRILRRNSRDNAVGPRLHLAGCASGNIVRMRHDVGEETANAIQNLAAEEPPLHLPENMPAHLPDYLQLLGTEAPVEHFRVGIDLDFPRQAGLRPSSEARGLRDARKRRFARATHGARNAGVPLVAGFVYVGEFWAPWCVAFDADEIASVAFAAGLGPDSAETGVYTLPAFRGRGYAAAATAGWASLAALGGRTLFYSTSRSNVSSRRVTQRLGLRFIGARLTVK